MWLHLISKKIFKKIIHNTYKLRKNLFSEKSRTKQKESQKTEETQKKKVTYTLAPNASEILKEIYEKKAQPLTNLEKFRSSDKTNEGLEKVLGSDLIKRIKSIFESQNSSKQLEGYNKKINQNDYQKKLFPLWMKCKKKVYKINLES